MLCGFLLLNLFVRFAVIPWVILPKLARDMETEVHVDDYSVTPSAGVLLSGLRIGPKEAPVFTCKTVRCRYRLGRSILRGTHVDEITLVEPIAHIVRHADGSLNLPSEIPSFSFGFGHGDDDDDEIDIEYYHVAGIKVQELKIVYEQHAGPNRKPFVMMLSKLSLSGPGIFAGETCTFDISAALQRQMGGGDSAQVQLDGKLSVTYNTDVDPVDIRGTFQLQPQPGKGEDKSVSPGMLELRMHATFTEKKGWLMESARVAMVQEGGETGHLEISGPYSPIDPITAKFALQGAFSSPALPNLLAQMLGLPELRHGCGTYNGRFRLMRNLRMASSGALTLQNIPLEPVLKVLFPTLKGTVTGTLDAAVIDYKADTGLKGKSAPPLELSINAACSDMRLTGFEQQEKLVEKLGLADFAELSIHTAKLVVEQTAGETIIQQLSLTGEQGSLALRGKIHADKRLELFADIGAGASLERRMRQDAMLAVVAAIGQRRSGLLCLPVPLRIIGTTESPTIDYLALMKDLQALLQEKQHTTARDKKPHE